MVSDIDVADAPVRIIPEGAETFQGAPLEKADIPPGVIVAPPPDKQAAAEAASYIHNANVVLGDVRGDPVAENLDIFPFDEAQPAGEAPARIHGDPQAVARGHAHMLQDMKQLLAAPPEELSTQDKAVVVAYRDLERFQNERSKPAISDEEAERLDEAIMGARQNLISMLVSRLPQETVASMEKID